MKLVRLSQAVAEICQLDFFMKKPYHQRRNSKHRKVQAPPAGVNLKTVAGSCRYVGSPYHKTGKSFVGQQNAPRPGASLCSPVLNNSKGQIQNWLRNGILNGHTEVWENGYPRYVWYRHNGIVYEARQGSPGSGEYHGYPLEPHQNVTGLP